MKRVLLVALLAIFAVSNRPTTSLQDTPILLGVGQEVHSPYINLSTVDTRQVQAIYSNPITLAWDTAAGTAKYKFIAKGSKGTTVKDTILPAECSVTSCEVDIDFPKPAQKYLAVIKRKDAAGQLISKTEPLELKTSKPEKSVLIEEVINSASSVDFFFAPTEGAKSYQLIVYLPYGDVFVGSKFPADEICNSVECGIALTASPYFDFGNYSWRIAAIGDFGKSKSESGSFSM